MDRISRTIVVAGCAMVSLCVFSQAALAIPPLFEHFKLKYSDETFSDLIESTKCNICHLDGKPKKEHNRYGIQLGELLDKDELKPLLENDPDSAKEQINAAFDKVAALPYAPDQEGSPTIGQVIASGHLPGADHDVDELIAAISEKPDPSTEQVSTEQVTETTANGSSANLIAALLSELSTDIKDQVKSELVKTIQSEIAATLKSELTGAVREAIQAEKEAEAAAIRLVLSKEASEKITELGGTVREIALDDDRKEVDFHLSGKSLTDEGLSYVKNIDKVIHLHLKDTQITNDGLVHLAGMSSLLKLHLEKTALTDQGLPHLQALPNLEWLNIYGTQVTDAGIEHLKELQGLKKLYIWQTAITLPGFEQLKQAMPNTEIIPDLVKEKQRAEEEAKRKEEEAKKAEEEAKKKAEEEAKKKAEEEAKKAEEEAKKAEEEAKKKAEEEAKKAEEEAEKNEESTAEKSE